jgi:hypothetical protein
MEQVRTNIKVMSNEVKLPILTTPLDQLSISREFEAMAIENGFETLEEMLSFSLPSLMQKPKFTVHVSNEFYRLLYKEGCIELLKLD